MPFSEATKLAIKKKAHFSCCLCHSVGAEVHHIIPHEEGGPDIEDNAAPLCPTCHETYGANPQKRKFIREARDFWYGVCEKRFAPDSDRLRKIENALQEAATKDDLTKAVNRILGLQPLKDRVLAQVAENEEPRRSETEILNALEEFFDKVWYDRHLALCQRVKTGEASIPPEIWKTANEAAEILRQKYGEDELGPWTDFDWGLLNGKLSALRWVLGDDWDILDT